MHWSVKCADNNVPMKTFCTVMLSQYFIRNVKFECQNRMKQIEIHADFFSFSGIPLYWGLFDENNELMNQTDNKDQSLYYTFSFVSLCWNKKKRVVNYVFCRKVLHS